MGIDSIILFFDFSRFYSWHEPKSVKRSLPGQWQSHIYGSIRKFINLSYKLIKKEVYYDFIEVMNCIGGCIAGGGQPKITMLNMQDVKLKRMDALYLEDEKSILRLCHENPEIKSIYKDYLGQPNWQGLVTQDSQYNANFLISLILFITIAS